MDEKIALSASIGSWNAKNSTVQAGVHLGKTLSGVSEVFTDSSLIEGLSSATISGIKSHDLGGAFVSGSSEALSVAAGLRGPGDQIASIMADGISDAAQFKNVCKEKK